MRTFYFLLLSVCVCSGQATIRNAKIQNARIGQVIASSGVGTFAFIRSTNANAAAGTPATATIDTTSAGLIVVETSWFNGVGTNLVTTAGTFTLVVQSGSSGGTISNAIWVCTSPTSPGAGKTFTFTAQYPNVNVAIYSLSSGTCVVDNSSAFNRIEGSQIGSIPLSSGTVTPSANNCLVVGSVAWDNTGITISSVTDTTNIREQHQQGGNAISSALVDVIQTTAAGVTPVATMSTSTVNACSGSVVVIKPQ